MMISETGFPDKAELSRAFFSEATRHLQDAQILHKAQRHPASIASSIKAAELGVKSVLILDGALGWWDKLMTTHRPFEEISNHKILNRHRDAIIAVKSDLRLRLRQLEQLEPTGPGAQQFVTDSEANPEYPFLGESTDPITSHVYARIYEPNTYFDEAKSKEMFEISHDVLTAIQAVYPTIAAWNIILPNVL